jgi:hypothetical protein
MNPKFPARKQEAGDNSRKGQKSAFPLPAARVARGAARRGACAWCVFSLDGSRSFGWRDEIAVAAQFGPLLFFEQQWRPGRDAWRHSTQ